MNIDAKSPGSGWPDAPSGAGTPSSRPSIAGSGPVTAPAPRPPELVDFARVLADATRQRIMQLCCCRWCAVGDIVEALDGDVSQPTVSHHLAVLREAGLVRVRREGRHAFYSLNQDRVAACCGRLIQVMAPESLAATQLDRAPEPEPGLEIDVIDAGMQADEASA